MTRIIVRLLISSLFLFQSLNALAETTEPAPAPAPEAKAAGDAVKTNPAEAEIARKKAKAYADQKDWNGAREQAEKATQLDPNNADAWLILGTAEQRLEHPGPARDAFRKYLSLNPPADKAAAVMSRVAELEVKAEKAEKTVKEEKERKYGRNAKGLILGFSPLFKPKFAGVEELDTGASNSWLVGIRMDDSGALLLRYHSGTVPSFRTSSPATTTPNVTAKLLAIEGEFSIVLNDPFDKFYGFQFFVPINIRGYALWATTTKNYMSFGVGGGTGGGLRFYTGGPVILDLSFLYHLAVPLGEMEWPGSTDQVLNAAGQTVKGNATGPEFRLAVSIVF